MECVLQGDEIKVVWTRYAYVRFSTPHPTHSVITFHHVRNCVSVKQQSNRHSFENARKQKFSVQEYTKKSKILIFVYKQNMLPVDLCKRAQHEYLKE